MDNLPLVGPQFITMYSAMQLDTYLSVAAATLYLYDLSITLDVEIQFLWPSEWSYVKVLYFLQRYLPLIDTVILNRYEGINDLKRCQKFGTFSAFLFLEGVMFSEALLTRRTIAVWGNKRSWWIGLSAFFVASFVPMFATMSILMHQMSVIIFPSTELHCFIVGGTVVYLICWIMLTVFEAGIFVVMAIAGFRCYREGRATGSRLYVAIYRDGLLYYLVLFVLSALNVLIIVKYPDYATLLSGVERVVHSSLTSRAIINIRQQGRNPESATTSEQITLSFGAGSSSADRDDTSREV